MKQSCGLKKQLTENAGASGVSAIIAGKTEPNQTGSLGVTGKTASTPETPPQTNEGWQGVKGKDGRIKLVIKRKPPPPPLEPFVCVVCETEVERDPYHPSHQTPPVCYPCEWRGQGRLQSRQLPFRHWTNFRRAYVLLAALDKEIARARHAN